MFAFMFGVVTGVVGCIAAVSIYPPAESLFNRLVLWVQSKLDSEE